MRRSRTARAARRNSAASRARRACGLWAAVLGCALGERRREREGNSFRRRSAPLGQQTSFWQKNHCQWFFCDVVAGASGTAHLDHYATRLEIALGRQEGRAAVAVLSRLSRLASPTELVSVEELQHRVRRLRAGARGAGCCTTAWQGRRTRRTHGRLCSPCAASHAPRPHRTTTWRRLRTSNGAACHIALGMEPEPRGLTRLR